MINSTALQTQDNPHITTINNERDIEEDGNSGQVTLQNLIGGREKRSGVFQITSVAQCPLHCAAI